MRILIAVALALSFTLGPVALCRADYSFVDADGRRWIVREEPRAYAVEPAEPRLVVEPWPEPAPELTPAPPPPVHPQYGYYWIAPHE